MLEQLCASVVRNCCSRDHPMVGLHVSFIPIINYSIINYSNPPSFNPIHSSPFLHHATMDYSICGCLNLCYSNKPNHRARKKVKEPSMVTWWLLRKTNGQPRTTTNNHEQPRTTTNNHKQPRTTTNNHEQPPEDCASSRHPPRLKRLRD